MLGGASYPHLCEGCRAVIDSVREILTDCGPDTDDEEAPINYVYDYALYCGGRECLGRQTEKGEAHAEAA